jgi:hypothetical protein
MPVAESWSVRMTVRLRRPVRGEQVLAIESALRQDWAVNGIDWRSDDLWCAATVSATDLDAGPPLLGPVLDSFEAALGGAGADIAWWDGVDLRVG